MKRIKLIILLFGMLAVLPPYACNTFRNRNDDTAEVVKKPNIIFIMADDMGIGDLGCYSQEIMQTPHIDLLASEGMRFTQHYAGNTVCAPSRCALMTGQHMGNAEIRGNKQAEPSGQWPLSDGALTVAELLKEAGYTTAMIGKWGLGVESTTGDPLKQGFDYYYGYLDQVLAHNYYPEYLLRNGKRQYLRNEVKYLDNSSWHKGLGSYARVKAEYSNDLFAQDALNYIEQQKDTSFFLYLPFTIPHNNGEAPENEQQEVPDHGIYQNENWPKERKGYAAMITRLDDYVGQIISKLQECGIDSNTIVFFTSDNGPMPDREFTAFFNSNSIFRGGKRDLYEGGIRVPLIVRWPGIITAGSETGHISAFWDFLPTACEVAGITAPADLDGISFLSSLLQQEQEEHDYLYWEFTEKEGMQALRKGNWKAVRNNVNNDPEEIVELYDLSVDPGEKNNLASMNPEIAEKMSELMATIRTKSEVFPLNNE